MGSTMTKDTNHQPKPNLDDPALYINRELSWLEFNRRVLEEAQDPSVPLLERLKFIAIFSSNLDEFFMVRVGGIQKKVYSGIAQGSGADRMAPREQLARIHHLVQEMTAQQYRCLYEEILPALHSAGIRLLGENEFTDADRQHIRELFRKQILPVLTPLAIDPGHPFPQLANRSLNLAIMLRRAGLSDPLFSVVQVPAVLPRFVPLPPASGTLAESRPRPLAPGPTPPTPPVAPQASGTLGIAAISRPGAASGVPGRDGLAHRFTSLETVIRLHLPELFLGMSCSTPPRSKSTAIANTRLKMRRWKTCSRPSKKSSASAAAATQCTSSSRATRRRPCSTSSWIRLISKRRMSRRRPVCST